MAEPVRLIEPRHYPRLLLLGMLIAAAALSESVGLILLVPLLAALAQGPGGVIAARLAAWGLPLEPGPLLALFVMLAAMRAGLNLARTMVSARLEFDVVDSLRARAWRALLRCDWRSLMSLERGDTASLLVTRVDQAWVLVNQGIGALAALATLVAVGLAALAISPLFALAGAAGGVLLVLAHRGLRARAERLGEALGAEQGRVHGQLIEGLGALRMIKSLGSEQAAEITLASGFSELRRPQLAIQRDQGLARAVLQIGAAVLIAALVWLGLERWHMSVPTLLPMVALFARTVPVLEYLQGTLLAVAQARPAVRAALALISAAEAAREPDSGDLPPPRLETAITLSGVGVKFGAVNPLAGIDASIPARGLTLISGPSGAGKSTLADLLGGLLAPDSGQVLVDGIALEGPLRRAWRQRVAYVQQDPVLLSASLRENLRWAAPGASDAALEAALEAASARFALALPQGLDTLLGDGGRQLSGGERQRLMLARALLRDPALLILDEATSALDAENEAAIAAALASLKQRMAVVVIGHRGALAALADQEIRLEGGRLAST